MFNTTFPIELPQNEPVLSYVKGSPERIALDKELKRLRAKPCKLPLVIDGKKIDTQKSKTIVQPHDLKKTLGKVSLADKKHIRQAIESCLEARKTWAITPFAVRAGIFLKAAQLIATKYRAGIVATTMLGQSKNIYQAEIDSACEFIDFLRFNTYFLSEIYKNQPISLPHIHNRMEYRALEGFIYAVAPFNFTSIAGNLACAPALCGNVVVWKPAHTQLFSAHIIMDALIEAGLPKGVINLVQGNSREISEVVLNHSEFSGLHFTGSTQTFNHLWETIGKNLDKYKSYPRIVGETGGKDFVLVHKSASVEEVVTALICGAFEYQGQKCSAASRAYIPSNLAKQIKQKLLAEVKTLKMGHVDQADNFINAVIDVNAYDNIVNYIEDAKKSPDAKILAGGKYSNQEGFFIEPTIIEAFKPDYTTMQEEIFGPVLTIYVYPEDEFDAILKTVDATSVYALTGAVFAQDRAALQQAEEALINCAGNFYLNDKPTGAVVAQQPFGGGRKSGTNDKSGSYLNLIRWLSPRSIKENFATPSDYKLTYPYMK